MSRILNYTAAILLLIAILAGCEKPETSEQAMPPVAIQRGDECHVCGMIITNYPGPKGQLYIRGQQQPYKYCSTRDLFSHLLQPEIKIAARQLYVHDMATTDWKQPANTAFINARTAWYVINHPLRGAMGPTLASFANQADARAFVNEHGGKIIGFDDITLDTLATLNTGEIMNHEMDDRNRTESKQVIHSQ